MGNPYPQITKRTKQTNQRAHANKISTIICNQDVNHPIAIDHLDSGSNSENNTDRSSRLQLPHVLLVDCMLEHLCAVYASNADHQRELYKALKKYLVRLKLLPSTDSFPGMDSFRQQLHSDLGCFLLSAQKSLTNHDEADQPLTYINVPCLRAIRAPGIRNDHLFASRYETDFKELEFIASGGFGAVYKASNKLDGNVYAIKKIIVGSHSAQNIIREVQLLSRLQHPNVVAYKSAWLEFCSPLVLKELKARMESESTDNELSSSSNQSGSSYHDSCSSIIFQEFSSSKSKKFINQDASTYTPHNLVVANCLHYSTQLQTTLWSAPLVILFIQMQLCPQNLRMWLNDRNERLSAVEDNWVEIKMFQQILHGIEYVHRSNIVHRDIKPDNIFLCARTGQALIGDFGLAKVCSEISFPGTNSQAPSSPQVMRPPQVFTKQRLATRGVGTQAYAAPEQLNGTECDAQSDMYSLGIVLMEMLTIFKTDMERHKSIEKLRKKQLLPKSLTDSWPELTDLIVDLASPDPHKRPTARQTSERLSSMNLANPLKRAQSCSEGKLGSEEKRYSVSELLQQIEQLKRELVAKEETIQRLTLSQSESI